MKDDGAIQNWDEVEDEDEEEQANVRAQGP